MVVLREKQGKHHLKITKHYAFKRDQDVMDTANQAVRKVFSSYNTYAFGRLPCSWSHFIRKQMAIEIHLFGPINTKI